MAELIFSSVVGDNSRGIASSNDHGGALLHSLYRGVQESL